MCMDQQDKMKEEKRNSPSAKISRSKSHGHQVDLPREILRKIPLLLYPTRMVHLV